MLLLIVLWLTDSNESLFIVINQQRHIPDLAWSSLIILGDSMILFAVALPFCGRRPEVIRAVIVSAIVAALAVRGLKWLVVEMRPVAVLETIHIIGPSLRKSSFPSGHATTIFTFVAIICFYTSKRLYRVLLVTLAVLVGISRLGVGAHWPTDVVAGAAIGWASAIVGGILSERWEGGISLTAQRILALFLLICTMSLLGIYDTHYPQANPMQYAIAIAALIFATPGLVRLARTH
ncbi:MAG: phosphatase PAP2 family protein [Gammaproteobacteria bacterium]|nr:phosphatase PAP2 family protein [Gammaproteobacteria bacterium]